MGQARRADRAGLRQVIGAPVEVPWCGSIWSSPNASPNAKSAQSAVSSSRSFTAATRSTSEGELTCRIFPQAEPIDHRDFRRKGRSCGKQIVPVANSDAALGPYVAGASVVQENSTARVSQIPRQSTLGELPRRLAPRRRSRFRRARAAASEREPSDTTLLSVLDPSHFTLLAAAPERSGSAACGSHGVSS